MARTLKELSTEILKCERNKDDMTKELESLKYDISKSDDVEVVKNLNARVKELDQALEANDRTMFATKAEEQETIAELNAAKSGANKIFSEDEENQKSKLLSSKTYLDAYVKYLKTNDKSEVVAMTKTLTTSTTGDNNGGVFIPTVVSDMFVEAMQTGGRIASLCSRQFAKGILRIPVIVARDNAKQHVENSGAVAPQESTFAEILLDPMMIKKYVPVTDELEAMASESFLRYILSEIAEEILKELDKAILINSQVTKGVRGITTNVDPLRVVEQDATGVLDFSTPLKMMGAVDDGIEENAVYVMNKNTLFTNIMTLTDTSNRPIYTQTANNEKPSFFLSGARVIFNSNLKSFDDATANEYPVVYGDFKKYLLNFPKGQNIEITRDALTRSEEDIVKYVGKLFAAGDVVGVKAFVKLKKGTAV